jgi:hypothetical protein
VVIFHGYGAGDRKSCQHVARHTDGGGCAR